LKGTGRCGGKKRKVNDPSGVRRSRFEGGRIILDAVAEEGKETFDGRGRHRGKTPDRRKTSG